MPRFALSVLAIVLLAAPADAVDPHMDPGLMPGSCAACHAGHGAPQSPMLPSPQAEVCLSCHDSQAQVDARAAAGQLSFAARPQLLSSALRQPYIHPLDPAAFSADEPDVVTCTSCHSAHRAMPQAAAGAGAGAGTKGRKLSPRDPSRFEYELCETCHGAQGVVTQSFLDLSRLFNPSNRSYHPVEAPAVDRSPSLRGEVVGREINCTDCHGNNDPTGPRGPHGSAVQYLLSDEYATVDGGAESRALYALCYRCHDRKAVLDGGPFPLHRLHVVEERSSCASCHSAHGSVDNRGLIRFGEETFVASVAPSMSTGRLAFVSDGPGSGTCYLTCHGEDHAPESYGPGMESFTRAFGEDVFQAPRPDAPAVDAPETTPRLRDEQ